MDIKERFGAAVRRRRQEAHISQEEFAMRIGADQAYVSRLEAGHINATLDTVAAVAEALGADVAELWR